ncbi:MAG: NAD-dependent deacylase [Aestuariivita sp.]|nr:NAD-dependent deacylase [Aestuariivita sp.]
MHNKIVILTGAGISAESGLGTFRDENGLWSKYKIEDVATPKAFKNNPQRVHQFYNERRKQARESLPNSGHHALARLQANYADEVIIVTQNVDSLHEKSGATVIHMHGELDNALCSSCGFRWKAPLEMFPEEFCPKCTSPTGRPDIVWFGEVPYKMDSISKHLLEASLFVAIGTSGEVYPAAGFVQEAKLVGAYTIEINLEPSSIASNFAETRFGPATKIVPAWVNEILGKSPS